ncbi:cyclic peptide export ABC transporter [Stigmatella hybrida]|uniref:cyclic peptide export ABC transporter n=1 Tax=Stigmatella hybrida TaxID=394097 RepID=UPI001CDA567E|nr:cyclic peptide export ABC transporter [Stigmatella hybrida]
MLRLLLGESRRQVLLSTLGGLVAGAATAGLLELIHQALATPEPPAWSGWAFAGLCAVSTGTRLLSEFYIQRSTLELVHSLRQRLARRLAAAPIQAIEALGAPTLLASVTDDVIHISQGVPHACVLLMTALFLLACVLYLALLSPGLLGLLLLLGIGGAGLWRWVMSRAQSRLKLAHGANEALHHALQGLTEGSRQLKLSRASRDDFFSMAVEPAAERARAHLQRARGWYAAADAGSQLLFFISLGLLISLGGRLPGVRESVLPMALMVLMFALEPLRRALSGLPLLAQAQVSLRNLRRIEAALEHAAPEARPLTSPARLAWRQLELRGIQLRHPEARERGFQLGPLDLVLRPGELVFLVGGNGHGKSTLGKILTGLYIPDAGHIALDGERITANNREWYRQHFSVVFSDHYLFEDLHARDAALDTRAREYLALLGVESKVSVRGGTFSTTALSQGQRKRLALAAALVEDRPLYVLDEWAAEQDPVFKQTFYEHILPALRAQGKTLLVISHDDRYFHLADRLLELVDGALHERS